MCLLSASLIKRILLMAIAPITTRTASETANRRQPVTSAFTPFVPRRLWSHDGHVSYCTGLWRDLLATSLGFSIQQYHKFSYGRCGKRFHRSRTSAAAAPAKNDVFRALRFAEAAHTSAKFTRIYVTFLSLSSVAVSRGRAGACGFPTIHGRRLLQNPASSAIRLRGVNSAVGIIFAWPCCECV